MRFWNHLLLAGVITLILAGLTLVGCSSDEDRVITTTDVITDTLLVVDTTDVMAAMVELVTAQATAQLDSNIVDMETALGRAVYVGQGGNDGGGLMLGSIVPDSVHETSTWIVSWSTDLQSGAGTLAMVDSLQYITNDLPTTDADGAQAMYFSHNRSESTVDTTATFYDLSTSASLTITNINTDTATVTGMFTGQIRSKTVTVDSTTWDNWDFTTSLTNLKMGKADTYFESGCPCSGTVAMTIEHLQAIDTEMPTTTVWELDATFTNGAAAGDLSIGNLSSPYSVTICTP